MDKQELRKKIITELNTYDEGMIDIEQFVVRMRILVQNIKND